MCLFLFTSKRQKHLPKTSIASAIGLNDQDIVCQPLQTILFLIQKPNLHLSEPTKKHLWILPRGDFGVRPLQIIQVFLEPHIVTRWRPGPQPPASPSTTGHGSGGSSSSSSSSNCYCCENHEAFHLQSVAAVFPARIRGLFARDPPRRRSLPPRWQRQRPGARAA